MLRKRIIFSLIYSNGYFNQSRNFRLQKVGDLDWLNNNYKFENISHSIDELIIINAERERKSYVDFASNVKKIVRNVFIPICAGGGIKDFRDAETLFKNGADKLILNSSLFENTNLVEELVKNYGSQSIVASIDYIQSNGSTDVFINNGIKKIPISIKEHLLNVQDLKIGEIYLNSIDKDGTGFGYDYELINYFSQYIKVPLIVAGGAGNENHLMKGLQLKNVNAVATANLFNFMGDGLPNARKEIIKKGENLAKWY